MWHVVILLPILGIAVFWLMPVGFAIPGYLVILLLCGLVYWATIRAMRKRPVTGRESLVGDTARVVSELGPEDRVQYEVEAQGALWSANSPDVLKRGKTVHIMAVDGLTLTVRRIEAKRDRSLPVK